MADFKGPLKFEPHGGYGRVFDGEPMPFGYISTRTPMPIFELDTPLKWPVVDLRALAVQMAAAPVLLESLKEAIAEVRAERDYLRDEQGSPEWLRKDMARMTKIIEKADNAIAAAEGRANG